MNYRAMVEDVGERGAGRHRSAPASIDVAVVTVIPAELMAAYDALAVLESSREKDQEDGTVYHHAAVRSAITERDYRVVLTCIGGAGNTSSAAAVGQLIARYRPRALLLMGIAAGIRGKVRIGEVILSERVVAYEPAALVRAPDGLSGVQARPEIERPSHGLDLGAGEGTLPSRGTRAPGKDVLKRFLSSEREPASEERRTFIFGRPIDRDQDFPGFVSDVE